MPSITKTPHRNRYTADIAKVNDQICFYLFVDAELKAKLDLIPTSALANYTPQFFPGNPYSARIHVPLEKLELFRTAQRIQTLGMGFSFAVERLLDYIEETIVHWATVNGIALKIIEPIDECLDDFCAKNTKSPLDVNLIKTIKYLRLRRNNFIHQAASPTAECTKLIKNDGTKLQSYWAAKTTVPGVSFSSSNLSVFDSDETITFLKVMRVCIEELDATLAPNINATAIAKILHDDLLMRQPELRPDTKVNHEVRIRKVKKRAKELHGLSATTTEIASALGIAA